MDSDLMYMRSLGRKVKRSMKAPDMGAYVKRRVGIVNAVSGSMVSVNFGNEIVPIVVENVRVVKSCTGVKAGDEVMVDTVDHVSVVTAILA